MKVWSKLVTPLVLLALLIHPTSAGASILTQESSKRLVKVLSDHPGAATALTSRQKSEIRKFLAKGKGYQNLVCIGTSLAGQRQSMYRVVRLRAELVCEYAKSIDPNLKTEVREKIVSAKRLNGRVKVRSF